MTLHVTHFLSSQFLPFLFAEPLKLHQVGWGASVHSHFQISPEMFNRVQVWALSGPLKDIHRVVLTAIMIKQAVK